MTTYTTTNLLQAIKHSPIAANSISEITLFKADEIESMEGVKQCMSGMIKLQERGVIYWMFAVYCGNPDIIEDAKHLYNFIVLDNNQIFHIHN